MALTDKEQKALITELASNGNRVGRAASKLNLNFDDVMTFCAERNKVPTSQAYLADDTPIGQNVIIATKLVDDNWPKSEALRLARLDYDRGDIDMIQHRVGNVIHQNVQRRRCRDVNRTPYFSRVCVE